MAVNKHEQDEDRQPFLDPASEDIPSKPHTTPKQYLRLAVEGFMALAIIVLFLNPLYVKKSSKASPVPDCRPSSPPHHQSWLKRF